MSGVLRTRKDGGTSICHASDKNDTHCRPGQPATAVC